MGKLVYYNGKEYSSVSECCKQLGISVASIDAIRKNQRMTESQAVWYYMKQKEYHIEYEYNGKKYASIKECCRELGLNPNTITKKMLKQEITLQEAIDDWYSNPIPFEFQGKQYNTLQSCTSDLGVPYNLIYRRAYNSGKTYPEIIEEYLRNPQGKRSGAITYDNVKWKSIRSLAKACGIPAYEFKNQPDIQAYIDKKIQEGRAHKPSVEDAQKGACLKIKGEFFTGLSQACDYFGVNEATARYLMKNENMTPEQAVATLIEYRRNRKEAD